MDVVKRTVKFTNVNYYGSVSMNDVVEILKDVKVPSSEVETFGRGSSDKEVSVIFISLSSIETLIQHETYKISHKTVRVTSSGRQMVTVRVHWLPVYVSDSCGKGASKSIR